MRRIGRVVILFVGAAAALVLALLVNSAASTVVTTIRYQQADAEHYADRVESYQATGTAIAPTPTIARTPEVHGGVEVVSAGMADFVYAQFATNTAHPPAVFATQTPPPVEAQPTESVPVIAPTLPGPTPTFSALPTILFLQPNLADPAPTAIPTAFPIIDRKGANLVNILLMGQDNEITGETLARTDTMLIVSINRDANTVALLSLPRDLYVYMPQVGMNRLNIAYGVGSALGWDGGPFFYMRQVILYNLGINVHYHAIIDLSHFTQLIDLVGGVEVAVDCPIQDYQLIGAEVPAAAVLTDPEALQYTLPVGVFTFTGPEALWYARSRGNSDDFDRGRRQQQILRAAFSAARRNGVLSDPLALPGLIQEGLNSVETDLRLEDVLGLIPVALQIDPDSIETYRLIRTYHTVPWQPPDGAFVQLPQPDPIFDLMTDFYTPPTTNQINVRSATVRVRNGSSTVDMDRVAVSRLGEENFAAAAVGQSEPLAQTIMIDYSGTEKGRSAEELIRIMGIRPANVRVEPDANRTVDYEIILGDDYNPCGGFVLPPE
jgi:LCP family protein required for cell wall assembly